MEGLHVFLLVLAGAMMYIHEGISLLELTVKTGNNITLFCDCKMSTGVYIVWYRNCSHENQPSLMLKARYDSSSYPQVPTEFLNPLPHFYLVKNQSTDSYDLLIQNITESDEGLYYCGTEERTVQNGDKITNGLIYNYGNATRITFNSRVPASHHHESWVNNGVCQTLLFSLCPAFAVFSSLLSFLLGYHCCLKKAKQVDEKIPDTRHHPRRDQDEDVCYAALEIRNTSQRPKKKKIQTESDFSTYSNINTSRM
ncbi:uncharacterized protein LOC117816398 [Xyrichtys novacula]|uniref:Uncharacterized protein LOC117816398 n=1 Tax=Xyrichtys novacula TaxID=13765 RepID=A0AAV1EU77_XYRNO|nr:uncharacterized protein LOC117816398 [Xyrichtys novacula]